MNHLTYQKEIIATGVQVVVTKPGTDLEIWQHGDVIEMEVHHIPALIEALQNAHTAALERQEGV